MWIDIHTHVFPDHIVEKTVAKLLAQCDHRITAAGDGRLSSLIQSLPQGSKAVVAPVATHVGQASGIHRWQKQNAHSQIAFMGAIHPLDQNPEKAIEKIKNAGFVGVKLHPDYQQIDIDDPVMDGVLSALRDAKMPVLVHCGLDIGLTPPYRCTPQKLSNMLSRFSGITVIAAHMGGFAMWDEVENLLCGKDIYMDTAMCAGFIDPAQFARMVQKHGADRILLGTDWPWGSAKDHLALIDHLPICAQDKQAILSQNAQRLLNI